MLNKSRPVSLASCNVYLVTVLCYIYFVVRFSTLITPLTNCEYGSSPGEKMCLLFCLMSLLVSFNVIFTK